MSYESVSGSSVDLLILVPQRQTYTPAGYYIWPGAAGHAIQQLFRSLCPTKSISQGHKSMVTVRMCVRLRPLGQIFQVRRCVHWVSNILSVSKYIFLHSPKHTEARTCTHALTNARKHGHTHAHLSERVPRARQEQFVNFSLTL